MQEGGKLGCFALTEKLAGVNSGLVVQTTAHWDPNSKTFLLNTPTHGAKKNWISQGMTADNAVVVADLLVGGESKGPHAFLMEFRRNGQLVDGVSIEDMGPKTTGLDLDNAAIAFDQVELPASALLSRYGTVEGNEYKQQSKVRNMDMIGQRLYTGRVAVAQAALEFRRVLFQRTKEYSDSKMCWGPKGESPLSSVPQLRALYELEAAKSEELDMFVGLCEAELNAALRKDVIPSVELVEAIAVAKVRAVEASIDLSFMLKNEVGSYALMAGTGFEQMDFLQCCKFAEGDSRILMQKMARDRVKAFQKGVKIDCSKEEEEQCRLIVDALSSAEDKQAAWDENWHEVYALANLTMDRVTERMLTK